MEEQTPHRETTTKTNMENIWELTMGIVIINIIIHIAVAASNRALFWPTPIKEPIETQKHQKHRQKKQLYGPK